MPRILAAMSGGVDSSAMVKLLCEQGMDVTGGTMWLIGDTPPVDAEQAADVCRKSGIPHLLFDFREAFRCKVIDLFSNAYARGETPNPCVDCNRELKFGLFFREALRLQFDGIATGHYARIEESDGRFILKKALDEGKDQSYVLYGLTQEILSHTLFPLGGLSKPQIRELARQAGLENADKPDSQDICFIQGEGYADFLERHGVSSSPGNFVELSTGKVLGKHRGLIRYTVGQRKGLGLSLPAPLFVVRKDAASNTVFLGTSEQLACYRLDADHVNWIDGAVPSSSVKVFARTRYHQVEQSATVIPTGKDTATVCFDSPIRAATVGQAVVFYDGDTVLGGGRIKAVG